MTEPHIPFGGKVYDRRAEWRTDEAALAAAWSAPGARVLPMAGTRLHVVDGHLEWLTTDEAPEGQRVLLGDGPQGPVWAVIQDASMASEGWFGLRGVLPFIDAADSSYVVHAVGLAEWQWTHRHCPRCGSTVTPTHSGHVLHCADCGRDQFPRSDPAVIMLVVDADDRVLLGRQKSWPQGRWSTLAGFVEPGESLEQAVRREVFEEAGVRVGKVDYVGSQPWPLPASLMLGFIGHAESTDIDVDGDEIEEARWFSREEALAGAEDGSLVIPPGISISRILITDWYGTDLPGSWS